MPLTIFQEQVARLLASQRSEDSHLAGGSAIHLSPRSKRYSNDLDYFHDTEERVASAFAADRDLLLANGFSVEERLNQRGFIRAAVARGNERTKVEWAHDTAWRFLPPRKDDVVGYVLQPVDLAVNKLLALVGRDEPRDFLDTIYTHEHVLSLGAMCWAAAGKDPGFSPQGLLDLLKRRGRYRAEDFSRLHLVEQPDLVRLKETWLSALSQAERFINSRPASEIGCLYYSHQTHGFVSEVDEHTVAHYGAPGGVLPTVL